MAVGVVVGGALAEVAQPADEVRGVGPDELHDRLGLVQRGDRVREHRLGRALELGRLAQQLDQVVVGALAADQLAQVGDRRPCVAHERAQGGEERRQALGRRLGRGDQDVEIVERRTQIDEGRIGLAQRAGQQAESARERDVLRADRGGRRVRVRDEVREVVAARGDRGHGLRGVDDEVLEDLAVAIELADEPAGGRQRGAEVLGRLLDVLGLARVLGRRALDDLLQALAGLRVERVEQLVEVDRRRRLVGAQRVPVVELAVRVRPRRQRDVAVGDARQRRRADHGGRAVVQRREVVVDRDRDLRLVVVRQLDLAHRADAAAADLDVVVLDELPRVLEHQLVRVLAAARQQDHRRHDCRYSKCAQSYAAGGGHRQTSELAVSGWGRDRIVLAGGGGKVGHRLWRLLRPR